MIADLPQSYKTLQNRFNILKDESLKNHTSFKVGGPADLVALPKTRQELEALLVNAADLNIPVTIFGSGTNLLVKDNGIRGLVICIKALKSDIDTIEQANDFSIIKVSAGQRLSRVCKYAIDHSLSGLEFAAGIPGTTGGAVMMNAGTPKESMSDVVETVQILNQFSFNMETIKKEDLRFAYRKLENKDIIIVEIFFKLKNADKVTIEKRFTDNLDRKKNSQPVSFASAGCFFKNPENEKSAGELIDRAGLKGKKIGDAMVSEKHANFIVNTGEAKARDILRLKELIQQTVFEKYNVKLETEVRVHGD
jgi:UDP-N-acetylmuramate dehydrogenase